MLIDALNWTLDSWVHLAIVCMAIGVPLAWVGGYWTDHAELDSRRYAAGELMEAITTPLWAVGSAPSLVDTSARW